MDIGEKIKLLRYRCGLTQEELADRCELTKGYISQLENDVTSPSIATLMDILAALGSDLKQFFSEEVEEQAVFSSGDYFVKKNSGQTIVWLVPNSQKNEMEPILTELKPGVATMQDMPHEGEEFGYVLSGEVRLHLGKKTYDVPKGSSFYFTASKIHYLTNEGKTTAKVLWVSAPPTF
ncbi:MAG: cupin domain-containing protein [Clostridia bacterium]|nr:cupin domain-containing protein [Clostridia bacterium]